MLHFKNSGLFPRRFFTEIFLGGFKIVRRDRLLCEIWNFPFSGNFFFSFFLFSLFGFVVV